MSDRLKLRQLMVEYFRELSGELRVCLPASIHKFDTDTQLASVQPLLKRRFYGQRESVLLPIVNNVPLIYPRTSTAMIRLPVSQGDLVTLIFADRSLEAWINGDGTAADTQDVRQHHLTDAYAILGGYPRGNAADWTNPDALEIEVAAGTKITIGNGDDELLQIASDAFGSLKSLCQQMSSALAAMELITVVAPSGGGTTGVPLNAATFATIKAQVDNLATDVNGEITKLGNLKL